MRVQLNTRINPPSARRLTLPMTLLGLLAGILTSGARAQNAPIPHSAARAH